MSQDRSNRPVFHTPPTLGDTLFLAADRLHVQSERENGNRPGVLNVPQCLAIAGCFEGSAQAYMNEGRYEDRGLAEAQAEWYRASARWMIADMDRKLGRDAIDPRWARWRTALATPRPAPLPVPAAA